MVRFLAVAIAMSAAAAEEKGPTGPVPAFVFVKAQEENGQRYLLVTRTEQVPKKRVVEVKVGDRVEKREETVMVDVQRTVTHEFDDQRMHLQRADGKKIDGKDIVKELGKGKLILFAPVGKLDPQYLKLLKDDSLILVSKEK